jgi:hypothetical protein
MFGVDFLGAGVLLRTRRHMRRGEFREQQRRWVQ